MSKLFLSAGLTLVLASTAAAAAPAGKSPAKPDKAQQTYCIKFDGTTGSRVPKTECHTKAEWAHLGVDIDARNAN